MTGALVVCTSEMPLLRHKSGEELTLLSSNFSCTLADCLISWSPTEEKQLSAKDGL